MPDEKSKHRKKATAEFYLNAPDRYFADILVRAEAATRKGLTAYIASPDCPPSTRAFLLTMEAPSPPSAAEIAHLRRRLAEGLPWERRSSRRLPPKHKKRQVETAHGQ